MGGSSPTVHSIPPGTIVHFSTVKQLNQASLAGGYYYLNRYTMSRDESSRAEGVGSPSRPGDRL